MTMPPSKSGFCVYTRFGKKLLRSMLALAQVLSALGAAVIGVVQPAALAPIFGAPNVAAAAGGISGTVYRDFNSNGVKDANETAGLSGVTVIAYDASGASVATATTNASGMYVLNLASVAIGAPLRIEFTGLPADFQASFAGGTNTQFVTASAGGLTVNYAVNHPSDYCQGNPEFAVSCYRNGNNTTNVPALYRFSNTASGVNVPPSFATNNQVGSIWGLAYQRESKTLFSSAVLKRHVGLGPNGLGAIYRTTFPAGTTSLFVDVTAIGVNVGQASVGSNSARGLPSSLTTSNLDATTFAQIGKFGIGDIDLSDDGTVLYFTNLFDRSAYAMTIGNPATAPTSATNLNGPWKTFACTSGVARPWATKVFRNKLYVGAVCTGENGPNLRANLRALVYEYDIASAAWNNTPVMNYALDYKKGEARVGPRYDPTDSYWHVWTDTYSDAEFHANSSWAPFASRGTPVLTDIEFDASGAMIMSFMDRAGMQLGYYNQKPNNAGLVALQLSGDILRACPNGGGGWTLESGGLCGGVGTGANGQGPGGGEFYKGDELPTYHQETIEGGMVQVMGHPNVVVANMDPININSGGITWLSNSTGAKTQNLEIYSGSNNGTLGTGATSAPGSFGKAVGLGDLEALCDAAPIQIGNRVWRDNDGDGIQDADEPGIPGVQVTLQTPTTTLTTLTDANGNYFFSNLTPNTAYTVRVVTTQAPLSGWTASPANAGDASHPANTSNNPHTDIVDSDYTLTGVNANIAYTTGAAGVNNHGLDFGFVPPNVRIFADKSHIPAGIVGAGQRISYTIVLTTPNSGMHTNPVISDALPAGTTFVAGSAIITGVKSSHDQLALDTLSTNNYSGGSGWVGNWTEINDNNNPTTGNVLVTTLASNCPAPTVQPCFLIRPASTSLGAGIERGFDISNSVAATVTVAVDPGTSTLNVMINDAGVLTTLGSITTGGTFSYAIPANLLKPGLKLRLFVAAGPTSIAYSVDNMRIDVLKVLTTTGTTPGAFLAAPNAYQLSANYPLTLTFAVTVNTPIPDGVGEIRNTVQAWTTQAITVTDFVTNPTGTSKLGNYVWIDVNKDGAQDGTDIPLSGVQVWLVNPTSGAIVATTTTGANGQYYFIDPTITPGAAYSIVVPLTQTVLSAYKPTVSNSAPSDELDSDGVLETPSTVAVGAVAPPLGQVNFSYDFGFVPRLYDWGDLPDGVSPTSADYNTDATGTMGPRHEIIEGLQLGLGVDDENNGQPNATATGDDIASTRTISDEDGIFLPYFARDLTSIVRATAQNRLAQPAYLYGFIDFNGDGDFADPGEAVSVTVPAGTEGAIFQLPFTTPGNAILTQDIGARFRLSTDAGLGPDGPATNGEVEDYLIRVRPNTDFGDLPAHYRVTSAEGGPVHTVTPTIRLGSLIDAEIDGVHDPAAEADDIDVPERSDEDGVKLPAFVLGQPAPVTVTVVNSTGNPVTVYGFIDFNGDGDFDDAGEAQSTTANASGDVVLNFTTPTTATLFTVLGARFRISSQSGLGANGPAPDGEVEDYVFTINSPIDYGDLPDSGLGVGAMNYSTLITDSGAGHPIIPGLQIGANLDGENNGQPTALADGDDISPTLSSDDEDGVTFPLMVLGAPAVITATAINTTGLPAYLYGFIDFNGDGDFADSGEAVSTTVPPGTASLTAFPLTFNVPGSVSIAAPVGARFRLTTQAGLGATGLAANGEVEDYLVQLTQLAQFGDRVFIESDTDGKANTGVITPVVGMVISATNGATVYTATTNAQGYYSFTVPPGTYTVTYGAPPMGTQPSATPGAATLSGNSGSYQQPGNPDESHPNGVVVTVGPGQGNWQVDFGFNRPIARFGDRVWIESDTDGLASTGVITPVAGMVITATNGISTFVTATNAQGYYSFSVPPGTYTVTYGSMPAAYGVTQPSATPGGASESGNSGSYQQAGNPDQSHANGTVVTVGANESNWAVDFAFNVPPVQFGDRVFIESDFDGLASTGVITPVSGMIITATNSAGAVLTTTTNAQGYYSFTAPAGTYTVTYGAVPAVYGNVAPSSVVGAGSLSGPGGSYQQPGNPDVNHPQNTVVTLSPGQSNWEIDFAFNVPRYDIGNRVWYDVNNDGVLGAGEQPVSGVLMELRDAGGALVLSTTTNAQGYYSFTNLFAGTYTVRVAASNFAPGGVLAGYWNSSPTTAPSNLTTNNNRDHGVNPANYPAYLADGVSSGPITVGAGMPVGEDTSAPTTPNTDARNNLTIDFGFYTLSLGNLVWLDTNNDGQVNSGEAGIPGVTVTLVSNGQIVSTTVTDANGNYLFTGLVSGTYVVSVTTPAGLSSSTGPGSAYEPGPNPNVSGADNDDNGSNSTGLPGAPYAVSAPVNLTPGSTAGGASSDAQGLTTNPNVDFGFYPLGVSLGNQVWFDTNNNGVLDSGEMGVSGVVVELYRDTDGDGAFTPGVDAYVDFRTTNAGGHYTFTNLAPTTGLTNTYIVVITKTNFAPGGALNGYVSSDGNGVIAPDPDNNADGDDNGTPANGYVASGAIDLRLGAEPAQSVVAGDSNWTVDFGFYRLELGNLVWQDANNNGVRDAGENGVPGVTVTLYSNGQVVSTTVTDPQGFYNFTNLISGTYSLSIQAPPGYQSSNDIAGTGTPLAADQDDNGIGSGTGVINSASFALTPGLSIAGVQTATNASGVTASPGVDFGVWQSLRLGNQIWFDADNDALRDSSEPGAPGVPVELYRDSNNDGVYTPGVDAPAGTTTTDAGGYYTFTNLLPGGYVVVIPGSAFAAGGPLAGYRSSTGSVAGNSDLDGSDHGVEALATTTTLSYVASTVVSLTVGSEPNATLVPGDSNFTIDFGFYKLELGNRVWEDLNNNGVADPGEPDLANVQVELRDAASGALISTTQTNASGFYTFTSLAAGTYRVVLPASNFEGGALTGMTSSTGVNGGASGPFEPGVEEGATLATEDNDHGGIFGVLGSGGVVRSGVITLAVGTEPVSDAARAYDAQPTIDFGLFKPARLGNYVWYDMNHDGVQNNSAGEMGVPGVTVTLYSNGVPISTTLTDSTGGYQFTNLIAGTYSLTFGLPPALEFTIPGAQPADAGADDSDAQPTGDPLLGATGDITLSYGESEPDIDAGVWQPAGLGDVVWNDLNGNGLQDPGEQGVPNVPVTLYQLTPTGFQPISTTTTNNNGYYTFPDLISGTYQVVFGLPSGYTWTVPTAGDALRDSNVITPSLGSTGPIVLNAGEFNPGIDAGLTPYAALGDYVWEDIDHDGFQDAGEPGVPNVLVTLLLNGSPISTTTTDASGLYTFSNLISATYEVRFGLPTGYEFTLQTPNSGDTTLGNAGGVNDSNVINTATGGSAPIVLNWGQVNPSIDAGIWRPASLGDRVWEDLDHDGVQDAGEPGIPGVPVTLLDPAGNVVSTTTTGPGGYYSFTNLISGTYQVQFTQPAGYTWTLPNIGADDFDSDASYTGTTAFYPIYPGDNNLTVDAGLWRPATLGDRVWFDINHNGVQDGGAEVGVPGVVVRLLDSAGTVISTTTTNAGGYYSFTNLISATYQVRFDLNTLPPGYLVTVQGPNGAKDATDSDVSAATGESEPIVIVAGENDPTWDLGVWLPASLGDRVWEDYDRDGVQEADEPGVPGVLVTLLGPTGSVVSTTVTDATGAYTFSMLVPTEYTVVFTPPTGYSFTVPTASGAISTTDSNANPINGWTMPVNLAPGEHNPTIDAGLWRPMSLGNQVWLDTNNDGLIGAGEVGVGGVVVELYADTNGNGVYDAATDAPGGTTSTDTNGYYTFTNLISGTYFVVLPGSNFGASGMLQGYQNSTPTESDANANVDNRDNGFVIGMLGQPGGYVASGPVVMIPGTEPTTSNGESAANGGDADANTNWTIDFGFYKLVLASTVWNDTNNDGQQNGGETGVPNVVVELLQNGAAVMTTTIDAQGVYTFTNLLADTPYVVRVTPPPGYTSSSGANANPSGPYEPGAPPAGNVDNDDNGSQQGAYLVSQPIMLTPGDTTGSQTMTNATGTTVNPSLDFGMFRPFSVGNRVWLDVNNNGVMDSFDGATPGIDGVLMRLIGANGVVISTTVTADGGYYRFDMLVAGDYVVEVASSNFGAGQALDQLRSSATDEVNPNSNGDANDNGLGGTPGVNGIRSGVVTLGSDAIPEEPTLESDVAPSGQGSPDNRANLTVDFGFFGPRVNLGNQVWYDANNNGVMDAGEPGVPGVLVELYRDSNSDGVFTPGVDAYVGNRTTDANGLYLFANITEGDYVVVITRTNFLPGQPLANYRSSDVDELDPDGNGDHNDNGIAGNGYVASQAINLTVGEETHQSVAAGDSNWSVDFGFYSLSIGDMVWLDVNKDGRRNNGEPGIGGVTVELVNASGTVVGTTQTDANGSYLFTGVQSGTYTVRVTVPDGMQSTVDSPSSADPNSDVDSDDNAVGEGAGVVSSGPIVLVPGAEPMVNSANGSSSNMTIDFGLWTPTQLVVTKLTLAPGAVKPGDLITYQIVITNVGSTLAQQVVLTDSAPAGTTFVSASSNPASTIQRGATTVWQFGGLQPGAVVVATFVVRVDANAQQTVIRNRAEMRYETVDIAPVVIDTNEVSNPMNPTAITLVSFEAAPRAQGGVAVRWRTAAEQNTFGFYILRSRSGKLSDALRIGDEMIVSKGGSRSASYELVDANGQAGDHYWLRELELGGVVNVYGPVIAGSPASGSVPVPVSLEDATTMQTQVLVAPVPLAPADAPRTALDAGPVQGQSVMAGQALPVAQGVTVLAPPVRQAGVSELLRKEERSMTVDARPAPVVEATVAAAVPLPAATLAAPAQPEVVVTSSAPDIAAARAPVAVVRGAIEQAPLPVTANRAEAEVAEQASGAQSAAHGWQVVYTWAGVVFVSMLALGAGILAVVRRKRRSLR